MKTKHLKEEQQQKMPCVVWLMGWSIVWRVTHKKNAILNLSWRNVEMKNSTLWKSGRKYIVRIWRNKLHRMKEVAFSATTRRKYEYNETVHETDKFVGNALLSLPPPPLMLQLLLCCTRLRGRLLHIQHSLDWLAATMRAAWDELNYK